jgi:hypothetical protein
MRSRRILRANAFHEALEIDQPPRWSSGAGSSPENAFNPFNDFFVVQQIAAIRFGKALFYSSPEPRVVFNHAIERFFDHLSGIPACARSELVYQRFFFG